MSRTFNAKIQLEVRVAPCKKVWFEKKEEPLPLKARALHKALNPQGEGLDYQEVCYLQWENEKEKQKVNIEKAYEKMFNIVGDRKTVDIKRLINFWQEIGPLFPGNVIPLNEALAKIMFAVLLIGIKFATEEASAISIEEVIINVLKEKIKKQPNIKNWTWFFLGTDFRPEMVPARKGSWPIFVVPDEWPTDREEIVEYARKEIIRNVLRRLKNISPVWTKKGNFIIRPASLYDAIIVYYCLESPKALAKKNIATKVKQGVLNRFRNYKYRSYRQKYEPLSEEEFEKVKQAINRAWEKGVRDKAELEEIGFNALERVARLKKARP